MSDLKSINEAILKKTTERAAFISKQTNSLSEFSTIPPVLTSFYHNSSSFEAHSTNSLEKHDLNYKSEIEHVILNSREPVLLNESEEIQVNGHRGVWVNKSEVVNWRGEIPITQYPINEDPNPDLIIKQSDKHIEFVQELAIRYLRPPTPPSPGEIIINQMPNIPTEPAPPLIIRQQPARVITPVPLVIREAPPAPPPQLGKKIITISGKKIPPPPRKVIIERLPQLPPRPKAILIERWLPYPVMKRKVIYKRPSQVEQVLPKPKNIIVQWEAPQISVKQEYKYLGIIRADPKEYIHRYGHTLRHSHELPKFITDIKKPEGVKLAAESKEDKLCELYGDLSALSLIDLDKEGLSEYKSYKDNSNYVLSPSDDYTNELDLNVNDLIEQIFRSVDRDRNGRISVQEAEKLVLKLNNCLSRRNDENDVRALFTNLERNHDGTLDLEEFRKAFLSVAH